MNLNQSNYVEYRVGYYEPYGGGIKYDEYTAKNEVDLYDILHRSPDHIKKFISIDKIVPVDLSEFITKGKKTLQRNKLAKWIEDNKTKILLYKFDYTELADLILDEVHKIIEE